MWVHEAMSAPAITVTKETSVRAALKVLDEHRVTSLPVVDPAGRVVGVVSEADLVREAVLRDPRGSMIPPAARESAPPRTVGEVMTPHPVTVTENDDLADAVELLTTTTVKSLPVLRDDVVVGMLSRRDVVHMLARDDQRIEAEVSDLFRADGLDWLAEVSDGVVWVSGPHDEHERRLAEALARSVPGVVGIRIE